MANHQDPKEWQQKVVIEDVEVTRPTPPSRKQDILNYGKPFHEQKWRPMKLSDNDFDDLNRDQQIAHLQKEFRRFKEGVFFYNNGYLEWLTGLHYFYLNYWNIDTGLPSFRAADREFFQLWDHIENDPYCCGLLYITDRGSGKTYKGTVLTYLPTSLNERRTSGIQSKTGKDAGEIFNKMVLAWRNLPSYMKPVDSGESNPQSVLKFEEPSRRSSKKDKKEYKHVLDSKINYKPADDVAYDGSTLLRLYHDEIGKPTKEADIYNRWYVCKKCVLRQGIKRGNAFLSTTVEDMGKKGLERVKTLWDDSDPNNRNKNGMTISGLYRMFKPADHGRMGFDVETKEPFIDEFGYSNRGSARRSVMNEREPLKGASLVQEMRKNPLEIHEAFKMDSTEHCYPTWKIEEQEEYNEMHRVEQHVRRGNFVDWENPLTGNVEVKFRDDPKGRFRVLEMPKKEERNALEHGRHGLRPQNTHKFVAGIDPISKSKPTRGGSNAAMYVMKKFDPMDPIYSNYFCVEYIARPPKVEIFFEDMIRCFKFYGCEALVENNAIGLINYFEDKGYGGLLMDRPDWTHTSSRTSQREKGIPMNSESVRDSLIEGLESYIYDRVGLLEDLEDLGVDRSDDLYGLCYFDRLLKDWKQFDPENWTPYDATVASGLTVMASRKRKKESKKEIKTKKSGLFPQFSQKGGHSTKL